MEQPCYKCGGVVEEGKPFCPHCAAPQIRVVISEPPPMRAQLRDVAAESVEDLPATETVPVLAAPKQTSQIFKHCAIAALVSSLLMSLGLNVIVGMLSAGFLAVVFYRQGQPGVPVRGGIGARLGIASSLICFGISTLLVALGTTVPELRAKMHDQIMDNAQQVVAKYAPNDPQFQAALAQLKTPDGFIAAMIAGGVMLLVLSIVLGGLGGFLGGVVLGRRDRR